MFIEKPDKLKFYAYFKPGSSAAHNAGLELSFDLDCSYHPTKVILFFCHIYSTMEADHWAKMFIDLGVMFIGIPGNLLIIFVFVKKRVKISAHIFIIGLAVTDCASCLTRPFIMFTYVPQLVQFRNASQVLCKITYFFVLLSIFSSEVLTAAIAVDRYFAVCRPHSHIMTIKRAKVFVALCVILCLFLSSSPFFAYGLIQHPNETSAHAICTTVLSKSTKRLFIGPMYVVGVVAMLLIVVLYVRIYLKVKHRERVRCINDNSNKPISTIRTISNDIAVHDRAGPSSIAVTYGKVKQIQEEKKTATATAVVPQESSLLPREIRSERIKLKITKMLFVTTVVFILTWLPSMTIIYLDPNQKKAIKSTSPVGYVFVECIMKLVILNHAINPFIYGIVSKRFRADALQVLSKMRSPFPCCVQRAQID